jgi:hypothetical protein
MRRLVDREFCCSQHRKRFRTSSARALRDAGELMSDYGDYLAVVESPEHKKKPNGKLGLGIAVMVGLVLGLSLWIVPAGPVPIPTAELRYTLTANPLSQKIRSLLPDSPKINLRHDFRMGVGDWIGRSSIADSTPGALRTDTLRLWKPTLRLADYQMEFQAAIEKKSVGWAYRATDLNNYYGAKINVGAKDGSRAEIERFVMLSGRESERVRLPIPVPVRPDTLYRVRMRIKGDQFVTSVDGQVVDTWRDRRLRRGGIGFFAEKGEQATIRWVSLSEPDGFFSRLFAMGFIVHPLYSMPAGPMIIGAAE